MPVTCCTLEFIHYPQLTVAIANTILITIIVFNVDRNLSLSVSGSQGIKHFQCAHAYDLTPKNHITSFTANRKRSQCALNSQGQVVVRDGIYPLEEARGPFSIINIVVAYYNKILLYLIINFFHIIKKSHQLVLDFRPCLILQFKMFCSLRFLRCQPSTANIYIYIYIYIQFRILANLIRFVNKIFKLKYKTS